METAENVSFRVENELPFLDPIISEWFNSKYSDLTEPQRKAIPLIHSKQNVLVSSPTGTGKTMTGFLSILNELFLLAKENKLEDKIYCLYISPLKALANDIDKNLKKPLEEIYALAEAEGKELPKIRVAVRSGDTPQSERQKMLRKPPHILITTPESFSLSLSAPKFKEKFVDLRYVILDEIHEISATKRGTLLSINLERLERIAQKFVRIGLSATQAPLDTIATYLCGFDGEKKRPYNIVDVDTEKFLDLRTITPVSDLTRTSYEVANDKMYDVLAGLINDHKTTLVFTNTRSGTEHVAMRLKARGIESIEAHHSSLGKDTRLDVENKLKSGELRCVITSTSLELGIDIGYIDLVVQIGSPKSVSKGLQRIGRSGHGINELSKGRFLVFDLDDLMECSVLTKAAYDREIDKVVIPINSLDVLSQALVGMALEKVWTLEEAYGVVRNSYSYHTLDYEDFLSSIEYLAGRIENSTIYPKIWFDEEDNTFGKKKSSRMIYFMNVGTIPEEADYQVINERGKHLGQLSDKFVERLKHGDIFVLGARTYMFLRAGRNRVNVKDATGMRPTVPSWTGEMLPRSYDLGVLVGKFREEAINRIERGENVKQWLMDDYKLDEYGATSLISYLKTQSKFAIPTDEHLLIEGYLDSENLYSIIYHIPLGRRINDALSRAYAQALSNKYQINTRITVTDDGFVLTSQNRIPIEEQVKLINSVNFEDTVRRSISNTEVFKQRFRHCAARSLMVLRKYKGYDISVARQQLRSDKVLKTLEQMRNFPVMKEAYHEIMNDMMDVPRAKKFVQEVIEQGSYTTLDYKAETSPFSYGLILAGVSDMVLMEDRSKLLKELQGKILDKIYGDSEIRFIFNDPKIVENYFKNKVPIIRDETSFESFLTHFLYVDPFRNRFNSPFPYEEIGSTDLSYDYIDRDILISSFIRGSQWTHKEYYGILRTLFSSEQVLNETDESILAQCHGQTFNEIKSILKISENDIRDSLVKLESAYLIRRKFRSGITEYYENDIEEKPVDERYALKEGLKLLLGSTGPMTLDEILVRLPVNADDISDALYEMVQDQILINDYVTPVFAKQYMLKFDLEAILGLTEEDILRDRIRSFSLSVDSIEEYFSKYGFAFDPWDMQVRVKGYKNNDLNKLIEDESVFFGRIIKNKPSYVAEWLAKALFTLRYETPSKEEVEVYKLIKDGYVEESLLVERTGHPSKVLRQIIRMLEYKLAISRTPEHSIRPLYGIEMKGDKIEAYRTLIEKFGPVSESELSRTFWFHTQDFKSGISLKPVYKNNELYYGNTKFDLEGDQNIILKLNDPLSLYIRSVYISDADFNARFIHNGSEDAVFYLSQEESTLWLENVALYNDKSIKDFMGYLVSLKDDGDLDAIIIRGAPEEVIETASDYGFVSSGNLVSYGDVELSDLSENDLLNYDIQKITRTKKTDRMIYSILKDQYLGIRNEVEASYLGITNVQLKNYFESNLIFTFNGPFSVATLAPMDIISVYRALKSREFSEDEQRIIRAVIEEDGATESEILLKMRTSIFGARNDIKRLYSDNVFAKDSKRRYIFVPEKYKKSEAVEIIIKAILRTFGFFDRERFDKIAGVEAGDHFKRVVKNLVNSGKVKKVVLKDQKKVVYFQHNFKVGSNSSVRLKRIITPKDLITMYFQSHIKSTYGTTNMYFFFVDNSIVMAFSGRKTLRSMSINKIVGDKKYRDMVKKEMNQIGYAVSFA